VNDTDINTDDPTAADDEVRAAARALVVAADRLHRAIAAASPPAGRDMLAALELGGCLPIVTVRRRSPTHFSINAGILDGVGDGRHVETYAADWWVKGTMAGAERH
jgi:hypothetical protein